MKLIILEANAEELRANKRVVDAVSDALEGMLDSIVRINIPHSEDDIPKDEEYTERCNHTQNEGAYDE